MTSAESVIGDCIQVNMWKRRASGCVCSKGIACLGDDGQVLFWKEFSSMNVYFWSLNDYHIDAVIQFIMCLREVAQVAIFYVILSK